MPHSQNSENESFFFFSLLMTDFPLRTPPWLPLFFYGTPFDNRSLLSYGSDPGNWSCSKCHERDSTRDTFIYEPTQRKGEGN